MYWKAQEVYVFWAPAGTLNPGSREVSLPLPWCDFSRLFRTLPWSTSGLYAWSFSRPFPSGKEVSWTDMLNYSLDFSCLIHLLAPQSNHPSYPSWFFKFKISLWPTPWGPGTCWKWIKPSQFNLASTCLWDYSFQERLLHLSQETLTFLLRTGDSVSAVGQPSILYGNLRLPPGPSDRCIFSPIILE